MPFKNRLEEYFQNIKRTVEQDPCQIRFLQLYDWSMADALEIKCNDAHIPFMHVAEGYCTYAKSYVQLYEFEKRR